MKDRITKRTMSDRQTLNFVIKHFNLKRLRTWKKEKWDESNKNNEIIDNLKEIREKLEMLEILKKGFVREGRIITYKGFNQENWDEVERWLLNNEK